ncbi:MAG: hypothetical protein LN568_05625 [Rickettsia endosymbiont of Pseudomimeciton antennatum]|nr:hypothetical protein [Rickettsia endosymbiont of Pseudomimeciton antennatum]
MEDFYYLQTPEGFQAIFNTLSDQAAKIPEGETILAQIFVNNANTPINKVMAYNLLNNKLFGSKKFKLDLINNYTEQAISLIDGNPKIFNVAQEDDDIINHMRMAYWFRAVYYNKSNNNIEAMEYYLKFLELIKKEDIKGYFEDIKTIISIAFNTLELSPEIDKIFTILSKKQGNENPDQKKLFKEIMSNINKNNAAEYLKQINKLQSANEVKSIALEVWEKLANQILDSAKDQTGLDVHLLFKESYLHLPYKAGIKHFSNAKNSEDLVQAVMFFLKYNRPQQAEESLTKIKNTGIDSILHSLDDLLGKLHLNVALSFIQQDIAKNKSVIKKHLDHAQRLNPSLDVDIYYTIIEASSNELINDDLKQKIQQNKELKNLVDEEIQEQNSYNASNQPVNLPISSSADVEPATTQNDLYQRVIHKYYTQKKRELDNSLHIYSTWEINGTVYSTKDSEIVDLGNNKYCVIDKSKKFQQQYDIYQKAMEKGCVKKAHGQNGVKSFDNIYEIKINAGKRLHNDHKTYVNPEGKELIIFTKETNHEIINKICGNRAVEIKVESANVVSEEAIQGTVDQDNILEQLLEYPHQYNGVDLGGVLHNVESD